MTDTTGYIYFAIKTENESLNSEWFSSHLSLQPTKFSKIYENGKTPVCSTWEYSSRELINPIFSDEIETLVDKLEPHKDEFISLKSLNPEFHFVLEIVIYHGDETPGLSFSKAVLDFVNGVGAEIDCDIYNKK